MEKRTILALAISIVVLFGYQYFFAPKPVPVKNNVQNVRTVESADKTKTDTVRKKETSLTSKKGIELSEIEKFLTSGKEKKDEFVTYENSVYKIVINKKGGTIDKWINKKYNYNLLGDKNFLLYYDNFSDKELFYNYEKTDTGFILKASNEKISIEKRFVFSDKDKYKVHFDVISDIPFKKVVISKKYSKANGESFYQKAIYFKEKLRYYKFKKNKEFSVIFSKWAGFDSKYFLAIFVLPEKEGHLLFTSDKKNKEQYMYLDLPEKGVDFLYVPKFISILKSYDPDLVKTVQFGSIIRPISMLFLEALKLFYRFTHNYGLAIILLTLLVKLLFFPLTHKSYISMAKMQKLQPEIKKIQKKYKDKPQEMNKKVMELYSQHKVNPAGGCLPMLLQLPVLWALYKVFYASIELKGAYFFGWIKDLSMPDTIFHLPFSIPFLGTAVNVLPLLMLVTMIWQQKVNSSQSNAMQGANKVMMTVFMPAFMLIIFYNLASGLNLYFVVSNLITIFQQKYANKHLKASEV